MRKIILWINVVGLVVFLIGAFWLLRFDVKTWCLLFKALALAFSIAAMGVLVIGGVAGVVYGIFEALSEKSARYEIEHHKKFRFYYGVYLIGVLLALLSHYIGKINEMTGGILAFCALFDLFLGTLAEEKYFKLLKQSENPKKE
ncbi:hypothetical protein DRO91_10315 [Candidatus Heimdallarchaeota archaeon]|nr:MAG: hypothetical protein DRP09_18900 [Candidatus Thorarchaeota archaeon]RLI67373.1 MAG: hypothetical protein DRO91_10315 [Candidatus Heimdallarchaeota archaeon]